MSVLHIIKGETIMNSITNRLLHQAKRPDGKINDKIRKFDLSGDDGSKGIALRLAAGAVVYLLTRLPWLQNGFGMFLQILAFLLCSYDIFLDAVRGIFSADIFSVNTTISLAGILAICIGKASDALLFMIIYRAFALLEYYIIKRTERNINRILNLRTRDVKVYADDKLVVKPTAKVNVGDFYMVAPGDIIPLDGIVVNGASELDTETLTGESTLRKVHKGSPVLSGCINVSGTLSIRVTADLENSIVTKRFKYVDSYKEYERKTADALESFSRIFTPCACLTALFIGILPPIFIGGWTEWLHKASVLLFLSCPLPIFAHSAVTYFAGVGGAAANGVLFKNREAIDLLNQTGCVLFDKTGTLSTGKFTVTSVEAERVTGKELMELAAYAFANSDSPIAKAVMANVDDMPDTGKIVNNYEEAGKCCVVQLADGRVVAAGSDAMLEMMGLSIETVQRGDTVIYVCLGREYLGCIRMSDKFRSDAKNAIEGLRELEAGTIDMLSGESKANNEIIAKNLKLDNAYTAVSKQEKMDLFEALVTDMPVDDSFVYVGNGRDEPKLLECADVGVAINGLISGNAMEYSNVIIVKSEPSRLCTAISFARKIKKVMDNNSIIMTSVTALTALLAVFGRVNLWSSAMILGIAGVAVLLNGTKVFKN